MAASNYWIALFTVDTWDSFRKSPEKAAAFPESRLSAASKIRTNDVLLFYLTGFSRFVGFAYADSSAFISRKGSVGSAPDFPVLVKVRDAVELAPEFGLPIHEILSQLSVSKSNSPNGWRFRVRIAPAQWLESDAAIVLQKLQEERLSPRMRPLEKYRRPIGLRPNPFAKGSNIA